MTPERTPRFPHDCTACRFLDRFEGHDVYVCQEQNRMEESIVMRYGPQDGQYRSMLTDMLDRSAPASMLLRGYKAMLAKGLVTDRLTPKLRAARQREEADRRAMRAMRSPLPKNRTPRFKPGDIVRAKGKSQSTGEPHGIWVEHDHVVVEPQPSWVMPHQVLIRPKGRDQNIVYDRNELRRYRQRAQRKSKQ